MSVLRPEVPSRSCGRVLVVEDNAVNRSFLVTALRRRGFTAFVAGNGEEAVRLARTSSCDAILMDIQMPGMDGFEAARRIRSMPGRPGTVPIIAVTALSGGLLQKRCAEAGFTAVFQKPFDGERLIHSLRERIANGARTMLAEQEAPVSLGEKDKLMPDQEGSPELVESAYLEAMVDDIGFERTKASSEEFVRETTQRLRSISEYLPGWHAEAIIRQCRELQAEAEVFGVVGMDAATSALSGAVAQNDRDRAVAAQQKLQDMLPVLWQAFEAHLSTLAARPSGQSRRAA